MFRNGLQPAHLIVVLVILVLLFGANRLPTLAKSVGESLKIFKGEVRDLTDNPLTSELTAQDGASTTSEPVVSEPSPQAGPRAVRPLN